MNLVYASENDSEKLIQYFQSIALPGLVDLRVERKSSFFDQYRLQSDDFDTLMLMDQKQEILGVASFVYRQALLNHQERRVAYATDLRISPSRQALRGWANYFLPVLTDIMERKGCHTVFSVLSTVEQRAYNTFVRPRHHLANRPRYCLFSRFQVVAIHGRFPFAPKPLKAIRVRSATFEDIPPLARYLQQSTAERSLRFHYDEAMIHDRLSRWPGAKVDDFLIASDLQNNIVGCVFPWSSERVCRYVPMGYHGLAETVRQLVQAGRLLGLTRPLPSCGTSYDFKYLTMLNVKNPEIFYALLWHAYERNKRSFLVYPYFMDYLITLPPRWFIHSQMPFGIYTLLPPGEQLPTYLHPQPLKPPPDLELALV